MKSIRRAWGLLLLGAILTGVVTAGAAGADTGAAEEEKLRTIPWTGYNEGLSMARDFDKPVFIHFTARWCKWCVKMQDETYSDPRVIRYMAENFSAVKVDIETLPALARKYQVETVPTLWFLDAKGKGLTSINGFVGPDKFLLVLEYIQTKAYEEIDYQRWSRKHSAR